MGLGGKRNVWGIEIRWQEAALLVLYFSISEMFLDDEMLKPLLLLSLTLAGLISTPGGLLLLESNR
jgi:hypothetical protein